MDTLRAMRIFVRTVELGSLSSTARELGTTQPTVSKLLAQLERQLAVRLLERSTRGLSPTEQGQRFYRDAKLVLEQFDAAVGGVQGMSGQAAGFLRISAPVALGQYRINAIVQRFLADHPGIEVELILNDRFSDMVEEGIDIAFRLGGALPQDAIGRHLATVPRYLVASPAYLEQRGIPANPADLAAHDFVRFAWTPGNTVDLFRQEEQQEEQLRVKVSSRFRVNNALAIREALSLGSGIGVCPEWLVGDLLDSGELRRVLPEWGAGWQDLYLLCPSRSYQPLRTRMFIDFAAEQLTSLRGFERPEIKRLGKQLSRPSSPPAAPCAPAPSPG
jgi:DNA-binding transcriptional LysR family regulator